jgi:hypothetical protein
LNSNPGRFVSFIFIFMFVSFGESCLLILWCVGGRCGMTGSDENHGRTVCQWFGLKTTGTTFSGLVSKPVAMVFSGLTSKPVATVSPGLASKPVVGFLVEPQTQGGGGFFGLSLKTGNYSLVI